MPPGALGVISTRNELSPPAGRMPSASAAACSGETPGRRRPSALVLTPGSGSPGGGRTYGAQNSVSGDG